MMAMVAFGKRKFRVCSLLLFLAFSLSIFPFCPHNICAKTLNAGGKVTMVEGHIENVTFQAIEVHGNYYYYTGVPIKDTHGHAAAPSQLVRGREVKLFFRGNVLREIMVFERPEVE